MWQIVALPCFPLFFQEHLQDDSEILGRDEVNVIDILIKYSPLH